MSKPLWNILLILIGALALWRASVTSWDLWQYNRLGPEVQATVTALELVPKGSKYALRAQYSYSYGGTTYTQTMLLSKPYYFNKSSAEAEIQKMTGMPWIAWVDAKNPSFSSLEMKFPLRNTFYAACLIGILLYFIYLRIHVELLARSSL